MMISQKLKYMKLLKNYRKLKKDYSHLLNSIEGLKSSISLKVNEAREEERQRILMDFIRIVDDMDRAMSFIRQSEDENLKKGVEMIYNKMIQFLKNYGVEQFSAKGKKFDPNLHEAMMVKEGEEDDIVVEEFEKGYTYKGKLLKPAKVVVSKKKK